MLVLTRREGQFIHITLKSGEEFSIHISSVKANQVRVGIEAPRDVQIDRGEILLETALKKLKTDVGVKCADDVFIEAWSNTPIPAFKNKTAKELTMSNPRAIEDVVNEIKRNFS